MMNQSRQLTRSVLFRTAFFSSSPTKAIDFSIGDRRRSICFLMCDTSVIDGVFIIPRYPYALSIALAISSHIASPSCEIFEIKPGRLKKCKQKTYKNSSEFDSPFVLGQPFIKNSSNFGTTAQSLDVHISRTQRTHFHIEIFLYPLNHTVNKQTRFCNSI